MAGGMRRRDALGSLGDRVHPPGPTPSADAVEQAAHASNVVDPPDKPNVKPCWVRDHHGELPGLLLEWRRVTSGFQGRVVRLVRDESGWVVVVEWLPAEVLRPGAM